MATHSPTDKRSEKRRRSQRVKVRIPVMARIQTAGRKPVSENSEALVVNAHGALILLATPVQVDQFILLTNSRTGRELLCRVATLGTTLMGKTEVAIDFIKPDPGFWDIPSPPDDWKAGKKAPAGARIGVLNPRRA
jgi:hypothetical protein